MDASDIKSIKYSKKISIMCGMINNQNEIAFKLKRTKTNSSHCCKTPILPKPQMVDKFLLSPMMYFHIIHHNTILHILIQICKYLPNKAILNSSY